MLYDLLVNVCVSTAAIAALLSLFRVTVSAFSSQCNRIWWEPHTTRHPQPVPGSFTVLADGCKCCEWKLCMYFDECNDVFECSEVLRTPTSC